MLWASSPVQLPASNTDFVVNFKSVCVCSLVELPHNSGGQKKVQDSQETEQLDRCTTTEAKKQVNTFRDFPRAKDFDGLGLCFCVDR